MNYFPWESIDDRSDTEKFHYRFAPPLAVILDSDWLTAMATTLQAGYFSPL
jgi:hypothetical protein